MSLESPSVAFPISMLLMLMSACSSGTSTDEDFVIPTAVSVDPSSFLGDVSCSLEEGAMKSYVATLIDITDSEAPFTLPSSPPTPCTEQAQFRYVVEGNNYSAEVDGYEELTTELLPLNGMNSGSRHMLSNDETSTEIVPRWTTSCGTTEDTAAVAELDANVLVESCETLTDSSASETAIWVDPSTTLGTTHACTANGGEVDSFVITPTNSDLPELSGVSCESDPVQYTDIVAPETYYTFRIQAFQADNVEASWGTTCSTVTKDGVTVTAQCGILTTQGGLEISIEAALSSSNLACDVDVETYSVSLNDDTIDSVDCATSVVFSSLLPGDYTATVVAHGNTNATVASYTCSATVIAGDTVTAECIPYSAP